MWIQRYWSGKNIGWTLSAPTLDKFSLETIHPQKSVEQWFTHTAQLYSISMNIVLYYWKKSIACLRLLLRLILLCNWPIWICSRSVFFIYKMAVIFPWQKAICELHNTECTAQDCDKSIFNIFSDISSLLRFLILLSFEPRSCLSATLGRVFKSIL